MESLDEDIVSPILTLVSKVNQEFELEHKYCMLSDYISKLINLDAEQTKISINVSSTLLKFIVEFLTYYLEHPFDQLQKPVPKDFNKLKFINQQNVFEDTHYITMIINPEIDLIQLVHIANYLGIQSLLELVCARVAHIIRDMTKEEEFKFLQNKN